jgi:hypothetical protein
VHPAAHDELGECVLELAAQQVQRAEHVVEERRAVLGEERGDAGGARAEPVVGRRGGHERLPGRRRAARQQEDRRRAQRRAAAARLGGPRAQARPERAAGGAELVEPGGE